MFGPIIKAIFSKYVVTNSKIMITFIREVHRVYLDTCLLLIAVNYSAADAMETNIDFYFQVLFHTRVTAAYGGLPSCTRTYSALYVY